MKRPTMSVAIRNLAAGKMRTLFSVLGVAVATLLLTFVVGLYRGWSEELVTYIRDTDAQIWVVGDGADSFFTPSLFFRTTLIEVQQTKGVTKVDELVGRPMKLRTADGRWDSYILGHNPEGSGGPVHVKKGSGTPKIGEIVIDDVLARTSGLDVGDEVSAGLRTLKVIGISTGGNLVLAQLSFVNLEEARILVGLGAVVNFALISTDDPDVEAVRARVDAVPGVTAISAGTFASNSQKVLQRSVLPILLVIVIMAVIVGTIVVGLTVYTAVIEKEREFGVLKALGVPGTGLLRVVFEQSLVCGAAGFVLGVVGAYFVSAVAQLFIPQVATLFRWQDIGLILVATGLMSLVAGFLPMQRILRIDTLSVFKA